MTEVLGPAVLFCPASRPDRYAKAAERADTVILDLEDAVSAADKAAARAHLTTTLLDPDRTIVRVNPAGTDDFTRDLEALTRTPYRTVMLAKAEDPAQVGRLDGYRVIALVETARGVVRVNEIAAAGVVGLMWGAEDLVASLGGTASRTAAGRYRDVARTARANVLLAAGAYGLVVIDAIHADIADLDGLAAEVADAAASGFTATACIHPSHVPVIRRGYAPTTEQLRWARAVLAAVAEDPGGVLTVDGQMIDAPLTAQARRIVERVPEG